MDKNKKLNEIEKELDEQVGKLAIWNLPFQSIQSALLLTIDTIDRNGRADTAMDFTSRLSYLFSLVKKNAKPGPLNSSTNAILENSPFFEDINFLNAYAHFSMLMPQFHRKTFTVIEVAKNTLRIEFTNKATEHAEIIDRLYSYLSQEMIAEFNQYKRLDAYLQKKVAGGNWALFQEDFFWLKSLYDYNNQYFSVIKPLSDAVFKTVTGFDYKQYHSFCAIVRAFSDYFIRYAGAFYDLAQVKKVTDESAADILMSEYFEYVVYCLGYQGFDPHLWVSGLTKETFYKILFYYISVYSDTSGLNIQQKSFCGEGFYPPFIAIEDNVLCSPHASKFMLTLNNILYSINNTNKKLFDEQISKHLEPVLIEQLIYVFSQIPGLQCRKNVNYATGEIDLLVLSENEKTVVVIQAKATIAPDSGRTTARVQDRSLEGIQQIDRFNRLDGQARLKIINTAFGTSIDTLNHISVLAVRSCAGSGEIWQHNAVVPIVNYVFVASIVADMIEAKDYSLTGIADRIKNEQSNIIKKCDAKIVFEKLVIGKYTIEFPNVDSNSSYIMSRKVKCFQFFPLFENAEFT